MKREALVYALAAWCLLVLVGCWSLADAGLIEWRSLGWMVPVIGIGGLLLAALAEGARRAGR